MVLTIPQNMQLRLGDSAETSAGLPQQAFAVQLSDDVLEDMIESIRNGQDVQLSLGDTPSFLFADHEIPISQPPSDFEYDLFLSTTTTPSSLQRLPNPVMSILSQKNRNALLRQTQGSKGKAATKPRETKEVKDQTMAPPKQLTKAEQEQADIDALSARFHQAEADRVENSTRILEGAVEVKGGKLRAGRGQLLSRPSASAFSRSQPGSPAISGIGSPSLGPTSSASAAQERIAKLRFPLIHELASRDQTFGELLPKWQGETDADFHTHLEKVAQFDDASQKWTLSRNSWLKLDPFQYPYASEEDRQKAIDNAIKKFDKQFRLGASDPLWQKLLPHSERGKGICLSKLQAALAKGPVAPAPKINVQSPKASSPSVDSEREDSGSSSTTTTTMKGKVGSEPMARTNSGSKTKKPSEAQAQQKRLLSNKPPKAAAAKSTSKPSSAKTSPKVSPVKSTKAAPKAAGGKGGRVLSKEFISDSDDSDSSGEAPLSKTTAASRKAQELKDTKTNTPKASAPKASTPKPKQQPTEKAKPVEDPKPGEKPKKAAEKTREVTAPKPKPAPTKSTSTPKILDTIRAEGPKPIAAPKRSRDDDDDSSSSGTPLSKRFKKDDHPVSKPKPQSSEPPVKHRKSDSSEDHKVPKPRQTDGAMKHRGSDSSQNSQNSQGSRASQSSSSSAAKVKTSPVKSSPLASSPPTNASDFDAADNERKAVASAKKRKFESSDNSNGYDKKHHSSATDDSYDKSDSSDSSLIKRAKHGHGGHSGHGMSINGAEISQKTRDDAYRFKTFYAKYEALHRQLSALEDPPEEQVHELLEMDRRLRKIKVRIQRAVTGEEGL